MCIFTSHRINKTEIISDQFRTDLLPNKFRSKAGFITSAVCLKLF